MNTTFISKKLPAIVMLLILVVTLTSSLYVHAESKDSSADTAATMELIPDEANVDAGSTGAKAVGAAIAVGLAAAAGAIAMGIAIGKSVEGISRQPEAEGKIRTTLMLGLVFIETAIIYALIIGILIIFVL